MIFPHQQPQHTTQSRKKKRIMKNHSPLLADPQINAPLPQIVSDTPTFHPVIPKYQPHKAFNTLPTKLRYQEVLEPVDILKLSLITSLIEPMTCNTGASAALKTSEQLQEGCRKWKESFHPGIGYLVGDSASAWVSDGKGFKG